MKKKIKNVDRPVQIPVFQHNQLFNHMGHGAKRDQQHQDCRRNQDWVWNGVKKVPHTFLFGDSP